VGRIKGVFRRFLSSPDESESEAASEEPAPLVAAESAAPLPPAIVLDVTVVAETSRLAAEAAPEAEVAYRIRNAFKRFLAALPGHLPEPTPAETASAESAVEAGPTITEEPSADATDEEKLVVVDEAELPSLPILAAEASFAEPVAPPPAALEEPPTELTADAIVVDESAPMSQDIFEDRVLDLIENVLQRPAAPPDASDLGAAAAQELASRLIASPLFGELAEGEMLAVVRELRLLTCEPGDVVVTEGEPGDSLFIITTGAVKVFVRNPDGRNFVVGRLEEGDFFGEISSLSGRRRSATVVAASRCELLSLEKKALDSIARKHPRLRDVLETRYIERASSPEAAAVRAVPLGDAGTRERAIEILEAHFGESRWDPRMRLRLANLLLKAGKDEDAVPILVGLADDLARQGFPEKAIAILKKIERIRRRDVEEVNLAPLRPPDTRSKREARPRRVTETARAPQKSRAKTAAFFEDWIVDVVRDTVRRRLSVPGRMQREERVSPDATALEAYGRGLKASPLFEDYSEDELLALVQGLRLSNYEPGDVILTEGEPGRSVFMLAAGTVRVFVRDRAGHDVALCTLGPGSFFGEIAALSGRPRSATVVAAARCELLELDKPTLDAISLAHPRIRVVLEDFYIARAGSPEAASIRTARPNA
jgi:CRP-like cAMP-binding protein